MSVDEDEYDGSEADGMESDGDGADPFVLMLEDDGHRLGRPARRGVGVVGFVPAPTRLSIPELDWLMRVRDGAEASAIPESGGAFWRTVAGPPASGTVPPGAPAKGARTRVPPSRIR